MAVQNGQRSSVEDWRKLFRSAQGLAIFLHKNAQRRTHNHSKAGLSRFVDEQANAAGYVLEIMLEPA